MTTNKLPESDTVITKARLPRKPNDTLWDIHISSSSSSSSSSCISAITKHDPDITTSARTINADSRLCAPALCHAHIHLDKCHLLHTPAYSDLRITQGSFDEAMSLTGTAKARFTHADLLTRGRRLLRESIQAGVTSMRAFVEVDEVVQLKCVHAGLALKAEFAGRCHVQICVFAQLALFSSEHAAERRRLLEQAVCLKGVDVVGSTPYVEEDVPKMEECVRYTIVLALAHAKHLDFHLDYNIDSTQQPLVWYVLEQLNANRWNKRAAVGKTVCLGHCTRLTLFSQDEWAKLQKGIGNLPISFVGLPTSDLFMQGRQPGGLRPRATLRIPEMIQRHGLQGAISINNVGNAFTPHGSCDPLSVASQGVGIYQAGTEADAELLYECVSSRAARAIGLDTADLDVKQGQPGNLVLYAEKASADGTDTTQEDTDQQGVDIAALCLPHLVYTPYTLNRQVVYCSHAND